MGRPLKYKTAEELQKKAEPTRMESFTITMQDVARMLAIIDNDKSFKSTRKLNN